MPDFVLLFKALLLSTLAGGLTTLLVGWPGRAAHPHRQRAGWILGIAAGIYAGCGAVEQWPRWPAPEDRDRLLTVLLPVALLVEIVAVSLQARWLVWLLRALIACAAAPILLYNTVYLADLSGPGSAEWSPVLAAAILLGLAILLVGVWGLLAALQQRTSEQESAAGLAMTAIAAAVTVMLSGYFRGGLLGLPVAGAIGGAALASCALPARSSPDYSQGIALIGLFSVLLIGHFFGALPMSSALCLWCAPLLGWLPEAAGLGRLSPRTRCATRLILVAACLIAVVMWAQIRFRAALAS